MKEKGRGVSAQLNSSHSSVTQPVAARQGRRMEQIESLHSEFEDLKMKIKDVESKNERIIENIHKRYDFKKKPATSQSMVETAPIVYYQQTQLETQMENGSVNSNQSELQFQLARPIIKKTSNIRKNVHPMHHQSMQYRKTEHILERQDSDNSSKHSSNYNKNALLHKQMSMGQQYGGYGTQSQMRAQNAPSESFPVSQFGNMPNMPFQMSMQFPPYPSPSMGYSQVDSGYGTQQMQASIRKERDRVRVLEKELEEKEEQGIALKRLQKKCKNMSNQSNDRMEDILEIFMQNVVERRFADIEKHVKKADNKLRRLQLVIRDKDEENRSIRNIEEHRIKRSRSRCKRDSSPRVTLNVGSLPKGVVAGKRGGSSQNMDSHSASKSKVSDHSKSSLQFELIASKYEEMIKVKTKDLEISESMLKKKEKELIEMSAKCASLELKAAEMDEVPKKTAKRFSSTGDDNLLANLEYQSEKDQQIRLLGRTVTELEEQIKLKQLEIKQKDSNAQRMNKKIGETESKSKKHENQVKRLKEELKKIDSHGKDESEWQLKLKRLQSEFQSRGRQLSLSKQRCVRTENEKIELQCENMTLGNRLKKIDQLLTVKEEKIGELEKIIQSNHSSEWPDLLERSVIMEKGEHSDIHGLQDEKEKLEEELTRKEEETFLLSKNGQALKNRCGEIQGENSELKREIETLLIQNESMKINLKALEFEKYSVKSCQSPLQRVLDENECISENEDNSAVREELDELREKYEQTQRQLKSQKHESLEFNTKLIKINSQLSYYRDLLSEREGRFQKLRKEFEQGRYKISQLQKAVQDGQSQLEMQKKANSEKIMQLQTQWLQFQQQIRSKQQTEGTHNLSDLRSSRNFSQDSFVGYKTTFSNMNSQNEHLGEKLKEAEKIIEIQKEMEDKIVREYQNNVDKIKGELREKGRKNETLNEELDGLKRKMRVAEQSQTRIRNAAEKGEKSMTGQMSSKTEELEMELAEMRQLKSRQESVQQELFKQLADKEHDHDSLVRLIASKEKKIEELQDLLELKDMNVNFTSNISSSQNKSKIKDSLQSNSSLKYSMVSNNPNRTIELDLSEAGESFYEQNQSMISNVSEVFGRDEFPYEKMQLRRVQQRRLFQKTAAYIKSLKHAIDQKNKKIKLLEKKVQSLRNSQLIRKDIYQVKQMYESDPNLDTDQIFKDYYSAQNVKVSSQRYKFKQLEHETKLTLEQNCLLNNQIESLQDELMKAEDQENSLMKLKDLYKDEIKSLIKKNQEQARTFEDQMRRERQKVQQSQSVQRMEALKQLYVKIMGLVAVIEKEGPKAKKREEHRRELEEYTKIFCNFLNLDEAVREKIVAEIRS